MRYDLKICAILRLGLGYEVYDILVSFGRILRSLTIQRVGDRVWGELVLVMGRDGFGARRFLRRGGFGTRLFWCEVVLVRNGMGRGGMGRPRFGTR